MKNCERCGIEIPEVYQNLLCDEHYQALVKENEQRKQETESQAEAEILKNKSSPIHPDNLKEVEPMANPAQIVPEAPQSVSRALNVCDHSTCGITDPNYKENPEADDKEQILANLAQFVASGKMLWYNQR